MSSFLGECLKLAERRSFYRQYWRYFDVVPANTQALLEQAYKLRYDVYCEENQHPMNCDSPDGMEIDAFDERAEHHLLIHQPTGDIAGTVRVIPPDQDSPLFSLPLQEVCDHPVLFNDDIVSSLSEISRLCMASRFRKRPTDGTILPAFNAADSTKLRFDSENMTFIRRRVPYAPLGLLMAATETALKHRTLNVIVAVSPEDCVSFKDIGMSYRILGPRLKHYGGMQPIIFNIKHFLDSMKARNWSCWEVVSDQGRLNMRADELALNLWHDDVFDHNLTEDVLDQLL